MPVTLYIPDSSSSPYVDMVRVYRRESATLIDLVGTYPLGTDVVDPNGKIGDEYHITFYSSTLDIEGLPSNIYRVRTPWRQDGMGVILELQTTAPVDAIDSVAIYKRSFGTINYLRIGLVPLGTQYFSDPDGQPGDEYHTTFVDSTTLAESQPSCSVIADAGSGLVVVTGFDRDIRDTPIEQPPGQRDPVGPGPRVYIELVWPKRHKTPSANGGTVVRQNYDVQVQPGGMWSVPLIPNDLLTVSDSFYKFTFTDGERMFKRVHSQNGSAQNFSLLEDVDPLELR